ncbi:hypothetical protein K438DRAFT_1785748 [Mycena galopus ATCC 62051]|nr:hypothetical protein K438DRAFT_1785748 [Mycena galopus ATCC 62051]
MDRSGPGEEKKQEVGQKAEFILIHSSMPLIVIDPDTPRMAPGTFLAIQTQHIVRSENTELFAVILSLRLRTAESLYLPFGRTVTPFTAVLRDSMGDPNSPSRLMKDARTPLPAVMPPRSGIALPFRNAHFASVGHCRHSPAIWPQITPA